MGGGQGTKWGMQGDFVPFSSSNILKSKQGVSPLVMFFLQRHCDGDNDHVVMTAGGGDEVLGGQFQRVACSSPVHTYV